MTRVAAIDCGTNSIRLLIADTGVHGLTDVVRELRIVRLGQGVDRTGRLAPEAIERTREALAEYAGLLHEHDVERVRMVATSATRDASNRSEFSAMVRGELGVDPDVVTGLDEAALSFAGAVDVVDPGVGSVLVTDIGGGSTELVRGAPRASAALRAHSMPVGCVRLTERHLADDPPTSAQVGAVVADVRHALDAAAVDVPLDGPGAFVGVAGTVTTVAAVALGHDRYDPAALHGSRITASQVHETTRALLAMPRAERAALPPMHPGRVDVICAGALVLHTLVEATGAGEVIVSEHDILDGVAVGLAS